MPAQFNDPSFIIAAVVAVVLLGLAKGGFSGLGALATPIMALTISPVLAAAILLPILIAQDVISVWAFRKSWDRAIVAWMLPGAIIGIALAYMLAASLSVSAVMGVLGAITFVFGAYRLWMERGGRIVAASNSPGWVGSLFGMLAGFTSQIAHAGGPPFQMWVTPKKLPHVRFVGTSSVFFAIINLAKVPAFIALGEFDREVLTTALILMPLAIGSTLAGVWLVKRLDAARFYTIIYLLMIALGLRLVWAAFTA